MCMMAGDCETIRTETNQCQYGQNGPKWLKRLKLGVDHRNWTEYKESVLLLTGVFPFDVGQVGRAGVADG